MSKKYLRLSQQLATKKFKDAHYEQINLTVNKGERDIIKTAAAAVGESVNGYICAAVSERLGVRVGLNKQSATDASSEGEAVQSADASATDNAAQE